MKKQYVFLGLIFLFGGTATAQSVKKAEKDTVKAGSSKDRLRNAGPVTDWPNKPDTAKKIKAAPAPARKEGNGS